MAILNPGDFPIDPATTTGTDLAARLNRELAAIVSSHSNTTRPTYLTSGGIWAQPQGAGGFKLFFFDGTKDHLIGSVDASGNGQFATAPVAAEFSAAATYTAGQLIYDKATNTYLKAKNANGPGTYNPGDWEAVADVLGQKVNKSGDTMSGALVVPAGATGSQVPRVSEVVKKSGDTMTGALAVPSLTVNSVPVLAGPAFSAYATGSQSVSNGTATKVAYNVEEYDTANCYDTATYRFTPNVAGYYSVCAEVAIPGGNYVYPAVYKNGTLYKNGVIGATINTLYVSSVNCHVYLNGTTDYIEVYMLQSSGSTQTSAPSSSAMYFQACMMRAA